MGHDGCVVCRGVVSGGRAVAVGWHSLVAHVSHVAAVSVGNVVVDVLDPAVGQRHAVGAGGGVAVPLLLLPEVGAAVVVGHAVLVGVMSGLLVVATAAVATVAGGGKSLASGATDHQGKDEEGLNCIRIYLTYIITYFYLKIKT